MVNVNTVYELVLFLANKEQRGYITPEEYNSFARQAQLQIFDGYFGKKVLAEQAPGTTDEYGDVRKIVEERLTYFDNSRAITTKSDLGVSDSTVSGFAYPTDFYSLGQITTAEGGRTVMLDEVSHRDLTYINLSPLTSPTTKQPVYTRHEDGIVAYPEAVSSIRMIYVRKPLAPVWAFLDDPTGQPIYDEANSFDFELNPAEEFSLVYRILTLAGVTIKQQDIVQFGAQNQQ